MKLLKPAVCLWTVGRGNEKAKTVMGDALMNRILDRGSIPLTSIQFGNQGMKRVRKENVMKLKSLKRALLFGAAVGAGTYAYKKYEELKVFYNEVITGNSKTLYYNSDFEDDSVAALGAAVKLNFLGVHPESPSVYLNVFALASSVSILVPDECRVILDGNNTASSVSVSEPDNEETEKEFTLYIDYKATATSIRIVYESALKNEDSCGCCCCSHEEADETAECDCDCVENIEEEPVVAEK